MTKQQYLLVKLAEECSELTKRATKMICFGNDEKYKDNEPNYKRLIDEYNDVVATIKLLKIEGVFKEIDDLIDPEKIRLKMEKVERYMKLSKERGLLN